jgi:DNA polymerase III subunit epsilon
MREIVLDTETTGLEPAEGHRIVEIGCVEIVNRFATGRVFHAYLNPERDMPKEAEAVHGLSATFLADKPKFASVADAFLGFVKDAPLVIHNAAFDMKFINHELGRTGRTAIEFDRVVDTLLIARRKHPGQSNSLDALCQRYGVDNSKRTRHGALLDAEILGEVYSELMGGRQASLILGAEAERAMAGRVRTNAYASRVVPLSNRLTDMEKAAHAAFVKTMGDKALWKNWIGEEFAKDPSER